MADHSDENGPIAQKDRCIDYIEFAVPDIARAKAFYGQAFGWSFTDYGPAYCEFTDGRMKGGFEKSEGPISTGGPLVVLYGNDLAELQKKIEAAGGKIVRPVFEFPGGRRFHFTDPEGYELAVWTVE
jgi:predicted enzyme related to lactoylglutathione lyase